MNPSATTLLLLLLFLSSTFHNHLASAASSSPLPILDTEGKSVQPGTNYYILPSSLPGSGGGLTLGSTSRNSNTACPFGVIQDTNPNSRGLPVKISPATIATTKSKNTNCSTLLTTATDLNIEFDASTICVQSTVWRIVKEEKKWVVGTGGMKGGRGGSQEMAWNRFKIAKVGDKNNHNFYKMVFCPRSNRKVVLCKDVGVFVDGGNKRRLGLTDHGPLLLKFHKA